MVRFFAVAVLLAGAISCSSAPEAPPPAVEPTGPPDVSFTDRTEAAGIDLHTTYIQRAVDHIQDSTGSGVAVADYDNDGDEDIYFIPGQTLEEWIAGSPPRPNALYRNDGDGSFTDVAAEAGVALDVWSNGAYFVDYDNDGDKDLFVTVWGPNVLYRNDGDGSFTDVSEGSGLAGDPADWSTSAAFADLDLDGDLDLYIANYCTYDPRNPPDSPVVYQWKNIEVMSGPRGLPGQADVLYRNNGDGSFTDVSESAGIREAVSLYGLGVVMADVDEDRDPDIYVANDSVVNHLWRNDGDLKFVEVGGMSGVATDDGAQPQSGMGVDAGDYDGDGHMDLFVTNFSHDWNTIYRNTGNLFFLEATSEADLRDSFLKLAWGTKFLDYNNDGWLDLFVANGHVYPQVDDHPGLNTTFLQANSLYSNRQDGTFENRSERSGPGLALVLNTRGAAVADFNGDGALDLFLTNLDASPNLLISDGGTGNGWITVWLQGTQSNRDGVGARLELTVNGHTQVREVNPFGSFQSQSSYAVHFGLGPATEAGQLRVLWPSGQTDELSGLASGSSYTIVEGRGLAEPGA